MLPDKGNLSPRFAFTALWGKRSSPAAMPSAADGPARGTNASAGRGERNAWTRCHHLDTAGVTPVGPWGKERAAEAVLRSCSALGPAPRPPSPGTCTQRHSGSSARCWLRLWKSLVSPASAWVMPSPLAGSQRLIMVSGSNFIFKMLLSKI